MSLPRGPSSPGGGPTTPGVASGQGAGTGAVSAELPLRSSQRQMSLFNMSWCFAKCGYMGSAVQAIQRVTRSDIRILALLNHAVYLILQLPLPYSPGEQARGGAGAGEPGEERRAAPAGQAGPPTPRPGGAEGRLPEEALLRRAVEKLEQAVSALEGRASGQAAETGADPCEDSDCLKYTGFWEKCQRVVHALGK